MLISVIIPTYKPQSYIRECLDSIVAQTLDHSSFEVIISLNGCREPWLNELQEYINAHPDVCWRLIHTDTPGVSNARNIALDIATGEYVTFIDDDDYISPSYLEELLKVATPDTVSLCYPYAFDDGKPDVQLKYYITEAYEYCILHGCKSLSSKVRKFFSGPCMKLIPMNFIQGRRYDVRFANGEDSLFMFLISDRIKRISLAARTAIYYRRVRDNSANYSAKSFSYIAKNYSKLMVEYTKIIIKAPFAYNFIFYLSRIAGSLRTIIQRL
ncbi:MAG: glycosyltransferase family 2 protein [Muribaculaceae bacterium]